MGVLTKEELAAALRLSADRIEHGECECMMVWAAFYDGKNEDGGPNYSFELRKFSASDFGATALDIVYLPAAQAVKHFRDEAVAHPNITVGEAAEEMLGPVPTVAAPQYSASINGENWSEPDSIQAYAIDAALHEAWCDIDPWDPANEVLEVEVGEAEPRQPADQVCGASVIYGLIERSYGHAPERYRPIPRNHRDSRGLRCVDPELVKSMAEDLEPALREVLRTWWEKHALPTWFEVPRTRTVKVRVKVDEDGELAGWEVVE